MEEFPIFKLPNDLVGYVLKFTSPNYFHRLYRVCKKFYSLASDKNFLLDKLEYDLQISRSELESLYDIPSLRDLWKELTPYLRYVRILAFYFKIIPASTAWISWETCVRIAQESNDIELLTYFCQGDLEEYLGRKCNSFNMVKCIESHLRGEAVKYEEKDSEIVNMIFEYVDAVMGGKTPPELKYSGKTMYFFHQLISFLVKRDKLKAAENIANRDEFLLKHLKNCILERFVELEDIGGCRKIFEENGDKLEVTELPKVKNKEFIKAFIKHFPNYWFHGSRSLWSPEFTEVFLENLDTPLLTSYIIPPLYLVKHRESFKNHIAKIILPEEFLAADIAIKLYGKDVKIEDYLCRCTYIPLKSKLCRCGKITSCNFCNTKVVHCKVCMSIICQICNFLCNCGYQNVCPQCVEDHYNKNNIKICLKCEGAE